MLGGIIGGREPELSCASTMPTDYKAPGKAKVKVPRRAVLE